MNYELARKLRDAGFPEQYFKHGGCSLCECFKCDDDSMDLCVPTLSELIAACEATGKIDKWQIFWENGSYGTYVFADGPLSTYGSTPEEAVANLWLALNEKITPPI